MQNKSYKCKMKTDPEENANVKQILQMQMQNAK